MAEVPSKDNKAKDEPDDGLPKYPIADIVALETVVNLLIRKGVLTQEELFAEERIRIQADEKIKKGRPVQILGHDSTDKPDGNANWLKERMGQKRWSRRIGRKVFGWKWKKVKKSKEVIRIEDLAKYE